MNGSTTYVADGSDDAYWSISKFQPKETDDYDDDFRFSPSVTDVKGYIYIRDEDEALDADKNQYYGGATITLEGAESGLALATLAATIIATLMTF